MNNIRSTLATVWRIASPYFRSEDKWAGRGLLAAVISIELSLVAIDVLVNQWYNRFYNALQEKNWDSFIWELGVFTVLATFYVALAVYQLYLNQWLQIRWRRWMTATYLGQWLHDANHYRMQLKDDAADNPDQRIAEDVMYGVAREVAALTGAPLRAPAIAPVSWRAGRVVRGISHARILAWLVIAWNAAASGRSTRWSTLLRDVRVRASVAHLRPRQDPRPARVRWARAGESLKLLNGQTVELDAQARRSSLMQAESLAGIMGGDATAVSDVTRNVYTRRPLPWWPDAVSGRCKALRLRTDAGHRFERWRRRINDGEAHRTHHRAGIAGVRWARRADR